MFVVPRSKDDHSMIRHLISTTLARCAVLGSVLTSAAMAQAAPLTGDDAQLAAAFDQVVRQSMNDGIVPGFAAALIKDGKLIYIKAVGVTTPVGGEPITARSRFSIGSVTKTLTSAAVMALQEEGRVDLDAPAAKYLPELKQARDPRAMLLKVRDLLSGRGCIPDIYLGSSADPDALEATTARIIKMPNFDLECVPGTKYVYPNFGMSMAGLLVQRVSGMPFEDYVQKRLFDRIGMKDSSVRYWEPAALGPNRGHFRAVKGRSVQGGGVIGRSVGPTGMGSASIEDMVAYALTLINRGTAPNGARVLSEKSLQELWGNQGEAVSEIAVVAPGIQTSYGLGWELNDFAGMKFISKGGSTNVMAAYIAVLPEQRSAVIWLSNLADYGKVQVTFNGMKLLAGAKASPYRTIPFRHAPTPKKVPLSDKAIKELVGHYQTHHNDISGFDVTERNGKLWFNILGSEFEGIPTASGLFARGNTTEWDGHEFRIVRQHGRLELWDGDAKIGQRQISNP